MIKELVGLRAGFLFACALMAVAGTSAMAADGAPHVDRSQPTEVVYPTSAQTAGEEGTVIINVYVDSSGKPSRYGIAKSSGFADLDNAALETVMNWHYVPAQRGGDTVADWAQVDVVYKLPK
jgi:periplasmic protein TonB